ncbi:CUB domain-containing protein [Ichthyenterobacterium magnum]|uniref:Putative secreted protein (Por secretion system target) n=1 Tax=Ichthyenterobacterium magnum TaxID=1230530 RepID=A0A420DFP3_9FLAO|nr:CUB domain-containing protein [Ichthyenterobacterium magnum]RKE91992.1 putative secreted protein (Por secretion system target) [Ichthyenterobacterium magnum]
MKKIILYNLLILFTIQSNAQGLNITGAEQFCSGTSQLTFNNIFGGTDNTQVGCLGSIPNAAYFYLQIDQSGDLIFTINQQDTGNTPIDVDFIAWGPFTDLADANANIAYTDCPTCPNNTENPSFYPYTTDNISDCSFDAAPYETMSILNALQGEIYVVLITNYDGDQGTINFQQTGGNGTTTCGSVPVCGSQYFDQGGIAGPYSTDESTTIYPYFTGGTVTVNFTSIDIPDTGDTFTVYNGPNNTFPIIGTITSLPATFNSTTTGNPTGAITFEFNSDNDSNVGTGWVADITCESPPSPSTCGTIFYDSGGSGGDYSSNEFQTTTFYPDNPGDVVTANFTAFNTESCCDDLYVFDGPNSTYPLLGVFAGNTIPGPFTSTDSSGTLTFVFSSDSSFQDSGWAANITCGLNISCGDTFFDSGGISGDYSDNENQTTTIYPTIIGERVEVDFTTFNLATGDILTVYDGPSIASNNLGNVTTAPSTFISTDISGALTFVFTSNSTGVAAGWQANVTCSPQPVCGSIFYDSGGASGNYSANELQTTTFTPDNPGDTITVTFTAFDTESCCDELSIYDGPDATYPLIGTFAGTANPGSFTSTDPSGALTFVFDSDFSLQSSGWAADITCVSTCNLSITDTVSPLGADDCSLDYTELVATTGGPTSSRTTIFSENFNNVGLPTGWNIVNATTNTTWGIAGSTNAGGNANEAVLDWDSAFDNGTWTLSSPQINITGESGLELDYRQALNHWSTTYSYSVYVETSTDNTNWTIRNSIINVSADVPSTAMNHDLSSHDGNTNLYVRFRFTGESFGILTWSIDNVAITANGTPITPQITWSPTTGLYTDTSLTTSYTGGFTDTVYAAPNGVQTYTATDQNSCTDTVTVTHNKKIWNGSNVADGTNWYIASNWTPSGVPTSSNCVVIPNPTFSNNNSPNANVNYLLGIPLPPTPAFAKNLTIEANGFLEIKSNTFLEVTDWVNVDTNGMLLLRDSASLVQITENALNPNTNTNLGNINMQRRVPNLSSLDYVYWSSPVENFNVQSISPNTPLSLIWKWLPTQPIDGGIGHHGDWRNATVNEPMDVGLGYIVRNLSGAALTPETPALTGSNTEFVGRPNNGVITQPISRGTHLSTDISPYTGDSGIINSATFNDDNWNLVGNPYPSAIFYDDFIAANNNINATIHLWTHQNAPGSFPSPFYESFALNYGDDYIDNNFTGPNPPGFNGYIAAGQAFFVLMRDDVSGIPTGTTEDIVFNNTMRNTTQNNNSQFYRASSPNENEDTSTIERHRIWLDLMTVNNEATSILVGYIEGATNEKDRLFDGDELGYSPISFYSLINEDKMAIQGRTLPFVDSDRVPLGIRISQGGSYSIAINTIDGLFENTNQNIFLEDTSIGITHDLRLSPYSFTIENGTFNDRFILKYTDDSLGVNEFYNNTITIIAPQGNYIKVTSKNQPINNITVYDVLGRALINKTDINIGEFTINNKALSQGTYIVKATLYSGKQKTQKVILKY